MVKASGSITTTTTYVAGGLEEISVNGTSTTLTKYFTGASGLPTAERVGTNGPLSYLASDGQGTVSAALDSSGNVTSSQLYTPYGTARYSSGSSPTTLGYTGQRADSATGLDYYQARYYDPVAGQFTSADTVNDGTNRYGYVGGNPTTATDPSGHRQCMDDNVSSCIPNRRQSSNAPYVDNVIINPPVTSDVRNADGTLTITTVTITDYLWSDGQVTTTKSSSSQTKCDTTCHNIRNEKTKNKRITAEREDGYTFVKIGATVGLLADVAELISGDFLGGLRILITALGIAVEAITTWASNSSGSEASMFDNIAEVLSAFLGVLNAVVAAASWGLLLAGAIRLGLAALTGGLLPLLGMAVAASVGAVAYAFTAYGENEMVDANYQDQMNLDEWCAQYGKGACEPA